VGYPARDENHGLMFGSMVIIGIAFEMHAPPLGYVGCVLAMLLSVVAGPPLARSYPEQTHVNRVPRLRRIALFGFLAMVGFLLIMW